MLFVDIFPCNFLCNFLTHRAAFQYNFGFFFTNITFRDWKKRIFTQNHKFSQKNKKIEPRRTCFERIKHFHLHINVHFLHYGAYFRWQSYDFCFILPTQVPGNRKKTGIRQNILRLKVLLCDQCQINWNENLENCDSFTSAVISRICGA